MKYLFLLLVLFQTVDVQAATSGISIRNAWKSPEGILVEMQESPELSSGNRYFWGNSSGLHQLEISWESKGQDSLGLGIGGSRVEDQWLERRSDAAILHCMGTPSRLQLLNSAEVASLEKGPAQRVRLLPEILDTTHVFQVKGKREYVVIKSPRFNYQGDIRVLIGVPGKFKQVGIQKPEGDWKASRPDQFLFASGGGIYLPQRIDLFAGRSEFRTGSLIRNGTTEELVPPDLSRAQLTALLGKQKPVMVSTPCDSYPRK